MGNQKQKWISEEEDALLAGIAKHGTGKWKNILRDPEFSPFLTHRSNIDLKDKWRNMSVNNAAQSSKDKSRNLKLKAIVAAQQHVQNSSPATPLHYNASSDAVMDNPSNRSQDGKHAPRYNAMIFEALLSMKDANGSDIGAILNFIEFRRMLTSLAQLLQQRHEMLVPPNFRRLLSIRLRRLVSQGKLEKVRNGYKIRKEIALGKKSSIPKQKDMRTQQQSQISGLRANIQTIKDAAEEAAYNVADAEIKSFLAAQAAMEAERISKMAEETNVILQLAKEVYEQCNMKVPTPSIDRWALRESSSQYI